jgi:quercetin dioxygenase-like cupin family protein
VVRPNGAAIKPSKHNCDILFNFVMEGKMNLTASGQQPIELKSGDAFVIPPDLLTEYSSVSEDLELLEVSLPGNFTTYYDT